MAGPSDAHEARCAMLETAAFIAGCTASGALDPGCYPDVLLLDRASKRLFVGDGKSSETSGNHETQRRLRRYARAAVPWVVGGYTTRFAICRDAVAAAWDVTLSEVVQDAGLRVWRKGSVNFDDAIIDWVDVADRPLGGPRNLNDTIRGGLHCGRRKMPARGQSPRPALGHRNTPQSGER
jgi:hypothetical protein